MLKLSIRQSVRELLQAISWAGLVVSLLTLIVLTPHLVEEGGGAGVVLGNLARYAWTLALLVLVFARTRTIGARALIGAALAGFFGVASLAVLIGKPLVEHLGNRSPFVMLVFAPISEELLKLLPVALFLLLSARNKRWRPSVGDAVLFGVTVASGFAVYENILYARDTGGGWFTTLPFSALLPFITSQGPMLVGTHVVYTGLASLGLGVAIIYRRRFRFAWLALPIALAVILIEHASVNRLALVGLFEGPPLWVRLALIITLHGYLSTLLFLAGIAIVAIYETKAIKRGGVGLPAALGLHDILASLRASPRLASLAQLLRRLRYESMRRSAILAAEQTRGAAPDADAVAAVKWFHDKTGLLIGAPA